MDSGMTEGMIALDIMRSEQELAEAIIQSEQEIIVELHLELVLILLTALVLKK